MNLLEEQAFLMHSAMPEEISCKKSFSWGRAGTHRGEKGSRWVPVKTSSIMFHPLTLTGVLRNVTKYTKVCRSLALHALLIGSANLLVLFQLTENRLAIKNGLAARTVLWRTCFCFFASDFFPVLFNWLQQATCKPVPSSSLAIASKRALEELWTLARRFKDSKTMQDLKNISKITLINIESTLRFWHSAGHAPHKNMVQNASVTVDLMPKPQANLPPPVHQAVQI